MRILERLPVVHQRRDIADRPDIDLRARQEGHGAVEIDSEAALDLIEDDALHLLVILERLLELAPTFFAARLVARQHGFTERILDPLEINFDRIADLDLGLPAGPGEFAQRHAAFGLQPDIDHSKIFSIPTTVPLTTDPSCRWPSLNNSSISLAKSSRDGAADAV